jgi:hypothetical protein
MTCHAFQATVKDVAGADSAITAITHLLENLLKGIESPTKIFDKIAS